MTADDAARLAEWAALADAATAGPWTWAADAGHRIRVRARLEPDVLGCGALNGPTDADAAFIAAARYAVPVLIHKVRKRDDWIADYGAILTRQADLLTGVANALYGPPPSLVSWSHHDLPAAVAALRNALSAAATDATIPTTMPARDMSGALIGQTVTVSPRFTGVARATGQVWAIRHQDSAVIVELRDETTGRLDHHSLDRRDLVVVHGGIE